MQRVKLGTELRTHAGAVVAPLDEQRRPFRWEWIDPIRGERVYAATADELLGEWLSGYDDIHHDAEVRLVARVEHAATMRAQVAGQLVAQAEADGMRVETADRAVLLGSSWSPPEVRVWSHPLALVLLDVFYVPFTARPAPISGLAEDVDEPSNLLWLRPSTADAYVRSLGRVGVVTVAERPAGPASDVVSE